MKKVGIFTLLLAAVLFSACQNRIPKSEINEEQLNHTAGVTLSIKNGSVTNKGLTLIITNQTEKEASYDMIYIVEQWMNDLWSPINRNQSFNAMAGILPANGSVEFPMTFSSELPPGNYRIIKPVVTLGGTHLLSVTVTI